MHPDHNLHVKGKTKKLLESDGRKPEARTLKEKTNTLGYIKMKTFCLSKISSGSTQKSSNYHGSLSKDSGFNPKNSQ
jgi:hypothetical protein